MKSRRAGFTLLEILTTIAIFGILVTITGYVYASALSRSRDQQRISDLQTISNGLEQFYLDNKSYPAYGANTNDLFLAKFQLEPYATCQISPNHKYLVPTYMSSIPEDPQNKFALIGNGPTCDDQQHQKKQYLYIPVFLTSTDPGDSPVRNFQLVANVERDNNKEAISVPNFGWYKNNGNLDGFTFCLKGNNSLACTHNYYLGPKKNN